MIIVIVFLIVFPLIWCSIFWLISLLSGWSRLSERYRYDAPIECKSFYFQSGKMGGVDFNSCLTLGVSEFGLRMSVLLPFRIGHPPLLIPWSDFRNVQENRSLIFGLRSMTAKLGPPPAVIVKLPAFLIDYVEIGSEEEGGASKFSDDEGDDVYTFGESGVKWECENCGEHNASAFELCWQCQHENHPEDDM